ARPPEGRRGPLSRPYRRADGRGGGQHADQDRRVGRRGAVVEGERGQQREPEDHPTAHDCQAYPLIAPRPPRLDGQQRERGEEGRNGRAADADEVRVEPVERIDRGRKGERIDENAQPRQREPAERYPPGVSSAILYSHATG